LLKRLQEAFFHKAVGMQSVVSVGKISQKSDVPFSSQVCNTFTVLQAGAAIVVYFLYGISDQISAAQVEVEHFHIAKVMLLPALLMEVSYIVAAASGVNSKRSVSALVVLEYIIKMVTYTTMAQLNGGIVHPNNRAWGPQRACYTLRYLEWSIAVPCLLAINNHAFAGSQEPKDFASRIFPNMGVTWAYVLVSWLAQVTPDAIAGWFLVALSFTAYAAAVWDQVCIVLELKGSVSWMKFKVTMIIVKEVIFFAYGVVYLLGCFDMVSSLTEQTFYTYSDVMLKVLQASCLVVVRTWEDVQTIQESLQVQVDHTKTNITRLIRKATAPMIVLDKLGVIRGWNEQIARLSGLSEDHVLGTNVVDIVGKDQLASLQGALNMCVEHVSSGGMELTFDPSKVVGLSSSEEEPKPPFKLLINFVAQLGDQHDQDRSIVGIGQDLTELNEIKAVQERKTRFTAIVSHELRSPLHGIMGLSRALSESAESELLKKQMNMIQGCANRLLDLVTNIMQSADMEKKLEVGSTIEDKALSKVNVIELIEEVAAMISMSVDKAGKSLLAPGVHIINDISKQKLPLVWGDPYKITQLMYNLATNACKFTKKGSIIMRGRHDREKGMVAIEVEDTGKGIAPGALKRIFQPFEQEDAQDTRSFQGVGLGLSVANSIVKFHKGTIDVKSEVDVGTTFTIFLPCDNDTLEGLKSSSLAHLEAKAGSPLSVCVPTQDGGQTKPLVLSVDDDEINQEVVERLLADSYKVVRAMNGMEALDYLRSAQEVPSVVLLDVMMPGMTGFDVVKEIRGSLKLGHLNLPVVMLSARSPFEETAKESFIHGASDCMPKPFNANSLKWRLSVIMDQHKELCMVFDWKKKCRENATAKEMITSAGESSKLAETRIQQPLAMCASACKAKTLGSLPDIMSQCNKSAKDEVAKPDQPLSQKTTPMPMIEPLIEGHQAQCVCEDQCYKSAKAMQQVPTPPTAHGHAIPSLSTITTQHERTSDQDFEWIVKELNLRDDIIRSLQGQLEGQKTQTYMSQHYLQAARRELRHMHIKLQGCRGGVHIGLCRTLANEGFNF